ncbi:MAG TPA: helix-turn-helix domain-containing protein [Firmicutes bacterium]|nr:helix-turn-helix domain-containing protein [Bacillota bacterium]
MTGFFRVGDKLLNRDRLDRIIDRIFALRASGLAQQEVAQRVGCDRSFVSRLESLAEVRKGGSLAVIGFPLANKDEISDVCRELGVEYTLLMTDSERWGVIQSFDGQSLLNWLMKIIAEMNEYDYVIMIGSDMRIRLAEAILGEKMFGVEIGSSPITEDYHLNAERLRELIISIKGD